MLEKSILATRLNFYLAMSSTLTSLQNGFFFCFLYVLLVSQVTILIRDSPFPPQVTLMLRALGFIVTASPFLGVALKNR